MTREAQMTINDIRQLADKWHNWTYLHKWFVSFLQQLN